MTPTPAPAVPFTGVWTALLTPLDARGQINTAAFAAHAQSLLAAGCMGVTPFGTTGEGPSFTVDERRNAIDGLLRHGVPNPRLLVSTGCAALPDVAALTRHAVDIGGQACLLLSPFFLKNVPEQRVIDAYSQVIDSVLDGPGNSLGNSFGNRAGNRASNRASNSSGHAPRLRRVAHPIPQVSGVAVSVAVVQALMARYPGTVVGLKDSGCHRDASLAFARALMPPLQVSVGNEPDLQILVICGSLGAVSGVANLPPRRVQRPVSGPGLAGANCRAQADQQCVLDLLAVLGGCGLTAAFKGLLALQTGDTGWRRVRAPLVAIGDDGLARLAAQLAAIGIDPRRPP